MLNIFRYLKNSWGAVLCIVALLILQAFCDLSLPTYTSNLVDVGISKKGIEESVPEYIRESELAKLQLFVTEEDSQTVADAYQESGKTDDGEAIYEKKDLEKESEKNLEAILKDPMMLMGLVASVSDSDGNMKLQEDSALSSQMGDAAQMQLIMKTLFSSETKREQRLTMLDDMMARFGDMKETMSGQMSAAYLEQEYTAVGIDMNQYQMEYLFHIGVKMLLICLLMLAAAISVGFLASQTAARTARDLRNRVFHKVVSFSSAEMDQFSTASLITRNTNDVQQIQMVMVMLLRMVLYAPILGMGGILKVIGTNVSLSWIIVAAVATIMCLVLFLFAVAMPKFKLMQKLVDRVNLVAREILTGLSVIRAFSTESHEEKRFHKANKDLASTQLFTNRVMAIMMPAMMMLMNLVSVGIIWFGGKGIDLGTMSVGEMMAFLTYAMQIIMSFLMLTMISIMLPRAGVAADRIEEVLNTSLSILDKEETKETKNTGVIEYNHVCFRYPNAEHDVISDVSFTAKPGETTAFIGSTGSGKSTLINLIPRFYDVTEGQITIDGIDLRDMKMKSLRDMIGYVPQKGTLFSGTIDSNIRYGAQEISKERVVKAAEIAQAEEFINENPDKYEGAISQGGTNVSGGQKQRLSIARAVAKKPKIYIFDDSFSALDFKTDVTLRRALSEETKESTVLIVAQRISTILNANQIIVMDEGRVVGQGTHQQLMENCEVYQQIAQSQLSEAEIANSMKKEDVDHE